MCARTISILLVSAIATGCAGSASQQVPIPVADDFVRQFEADGARLTADGNALVASVRDGLAIEMTEAVRARRAQAMARWLWRRHGRAAGVEYIRVLLIVPGIGETVLAEHRFGRAQMEN